MHEQFHDLAGFRDALSGLMALRATARRFGREVQCRKTFLDAKPVRGMPMRQAVGRLGPDSERRAVMTWLTRSGPFWDDLRRHDGGDWLECGPDDIVTDHAVGEAAFRTLHGAPCGLVSLTPSAWCRSPVDVTWVREAEGADNRSTEVENWWCAETLDRSLRRRQRPVGSWDALRDLATGRFAGLAFTENCFAPLDPVPFAKSSADRLLMLLDVLDRLAQAFGDDGRRTAEGHRLYQDHFTGSRALFSDSSDSEKHRFGKELTFPHPDDPSRTLFCPWHGKERHATLRLHFSWPVQAGKPVHVVYAGPKITKR